MLKIERDLDFIKNRLPNEMNLGFFLVELKEFKEKLSEDLNAKNEKMKQRIYIKYKETLQSHQKLSTEILNELKDEPKTIKEFIEKNMYIEGDELKTNIYKMELYLVMI